LGFEDVGWEIDLGFEDVGWEIDLCVDNCWDFGSQMGNQKNFGC